MFNIIESIENTYGIPSDRIRTILCALSCFPLGFVLRRLLFASHGLSCVFIIMVGILFSYFTVGTACIHAIMMVIISYSLFYVLSPMYVGYVTLIYGLIHLSYCHIYRMYYDYNGYTLDVSGIIMILVQKVSYVAFEHQDQMANGKCYSTVPSILDYGAYCFFYPSILLGPSCNFTIFYDYIHLNTYTSNNIKRKQLTYLIPALKKLGLGCVYFVLYLLVNHFFVITHVIDDNFIQSSSFLYYFYYTAIVCYTRRFQYYAAFLISAGCCNASMFGYCGNDDNNNQQWDLVDQIHPFQIDLATNFKEVTDNWNIQTSKWIREISYKRSTKMRVFKSFMLSAMWHGFYPGYYITFISGFMVVNIMRNYRKNVRPLFLTGRASTKIVYDIITWAITQLYLIYFIIPFIYLNLTDSLKIMRKLYYFGHVGFVVAYILYNMIVSISSYLSLHSKKAK